MLSVVLRKICASVSALSDSSGDVLPSAEPSAADGTPEGPIEHATRARHDPGTPPRAHHGSAVRSPVTR